VDRARNLSRAAGFWTTMLSMRLGARLVLSAAALAAAVPAAAEANTYCAGAVPHF
jgi:hypothetical protein